MVTVWAVGTNRAGGHPVAVAADAQAAEYVVAGDVEDFYTERLDALIESGFIAERPDNYMDWLAAATSGLGMNWRVMGEASSRDEAKRLAANYLAEPTPSASRLAATQNVALSYDEYDLETDLSVDDELDVMHEMAGGVDPDQPHMWLPPFIGAEECIFCERPQSDTLHPIGVTMPGNVSAPDVPPAQTEDTNLEGES